MAIRLPKYSLQQKQLSQLILKLFMRKTKNFSVQHAMQNLHKSHISSVHEGKKRILKNKKIL